MKVPYKPWARYALGMLVIVPTLFVFGCSTKPSGPPEADEMAEESEEIPGGIELEEEAIASLRLSTGVAERRSLAPVIEVPAELGPVPDRQATVGPRVGGRVVKVFVNVGDRVKKGSPLMALESADVGEAQADLLADQARVEVAEQAAERARRLRENRVTSQRAVEEAEGALRQARAEVEAARTRLIAYGVDPLRTRQPGQVVLESPMSGTIVGREVHIGQWLEPGDAVLEIVDLDVLWLVGAVYENDLRHVQEGRSVEVEVRALPGEQFAGTVDYVGSRLGSGRTADLRVVMANPDHRLRPGMFATARIAQAEEGGREVLAVPFVAVQEVDRRALVFVPEGESNFSVRWIQIGIRQGDWVEVVDGLGEGETLVTQGSLLLKGQLLRSSLGEEE